MPRLIGFAAAASVLLNGLAIWFGRGSFVHLLAAIVVAAYVGLPAFIAGTLFYALRARYVRARTIATIAWTVAAIALSMLVSLWPGQRLAARDIEEAKAYCEALALRLEQRKQAAGTYPSDLGGLHERGNGPRLVRQSLFYSSDGRQFELLFADPRGLMEGLAYHSGDRRWVAWD